MTDDEIHSRLNKAREAAWEKVPFLRQAAILLLWRRLGYKPMWILAGNSDEKGLPNKSIMQVSGPFFFYIIKRDIVAYAPSVVLEACCGCMFAHTSRFLLRSRARIHIHGNDGNLMSDEWKKSFRLAKRWDFTTERIEGLI